MKLPRENIENEKRYTQKRLEEFLRKRGYK